jgi:hypothetical protein
LDKLNDSGYVSLFEIIKKIHFLFVRNYQVFIKMLMLFKEEDKYDKCNTKLFNIIASLDKHQRCDIYCNKRYSTSKDKIKVIG